MRRLADRVVAFLLRLAPWYHPEEVEARDVRSERIHRMAIAARVEYESSRDPRLRSYGRSRLPR